MTKRTFKQADKRYRALFSPAMLLMSAAIFGGAVLVDRSAQDNLVVRVVAGLAAGVPLVVAMWALVRFVGETDEFTRQLNLKALAVAGAITVSAASVIGFLQMYEVVPQFPAFWVIILYLLAFTLTHKLTAKKAAQPGADET